MAVTRFINPHVCWDMLGYGAPTLIVRSIHSVYLRLWIGSHGTKQTYVHESWKLLVINNGHCNDHGTYRCLAEKHCRHDLGVTFSFACSARYFWYLLIMNKSVKVHVGSMMIMAHIGLIPLLVCPPWKPSQKPPKGFSTKWFPYFSWFISPTIEISMISSIKIYKYL